MINYTRAKEQFEQQNEPVIEELDTIITNHINNEFVPGTALMIRSKTPNEYVQNQIVSIGADQGWKITFHNVKEDICQIFLTELIKEEQEQKSDSTPDKPSNL